MAMSQTATLVSVALDATQEPPLYVQLFEQVRDLILSGRLKPRQRLPSTRALAKDLNVSRTTTLAAYEQLMSEGYIEGREGSGAYVAPTLPEDLLLVRSPQKPGGAVPGFTTSPRAPDTAVPAERRTDRAFSSSGHDARLFPFAEWSRLLAKSWRAPRPELLHLEHGFGYLPLRHAIAAHLRELRGVECTAEQVVITSSAAQSVSLLVRTLLGRSDTVFVEDPGYPTIYRALEGLGTNAVPSEVDDQGFTIPDEARGNTSASAAIITPSRQYPLGMTMPLTRRLEVLSWAEATDTWIIEDDYDSEYRYVGRPLSALMSLDRIGRVIYVGSFSKTMFKSLRLGFVIVPHALIGPVQATLRADGAGASAIAQPAMSEFISSGQFAAHIRRMRRIYSERQQALLSALDTGFDGLLDVPRQSAGMHLPVFFTDALSERLSDIEAAARLSDAGVSAEPLSPHYERMKPRQGLLLGFAAFTPDELRTAALVMSGVLDQSRFQ